MNEYIVTQNVIIHETSVDFVLRSVGKEVHLVQYDNLLPVIKVNLYNNGEKYILPNEAHVNLRFGKVDRTFVYEEALGCNHDRDAVYFAVTDQMTVINSTVAPVVEIVIGTDHSSSSSFKVIIDKNPIQDSDLESQVDLSVVQSLVYEANQAAQIAVEAKNYIISIIGGGYVTLDTIQHITGEKTIDKLHINNYLYFEQTAKIHGSIIPDNDAVYDIGTGAARINDVQAVRIIGQKLILGATELNEEKLQKLLELLEVFVVEEVS